MEVQFFSLDNVTIQFHPLWMEAQFRDVPPRVDGCPDMNECTVQNLDIRPGRDGCTARSLDVCPGRDGCTWVEMCAQLRTWDWIDVLSKALDLVIESETTNLELVHVICA